VPNPNFTIRNFSIAAQRALSPRADRAFAATLLACVLTMEAEDPAHTRPSWIDDPWVRRLCLRLCLPSASPPTASLSTLHAKGVEDARELKETRTNRNTAKRATHTLSQPRHQGQLRHPHTNPPPKRPCRHPPNYKFSRRLLPFLAIFSAPEYVARRFSPRGAPRVKTGFGFVRHSIANLCHEVPNPNLTIRRFCIACMWPGGSRHVVRRF
jgi:hypothetical protein